MVAVDTNVVLRLLTGDDPEQTAIAEAAVAGGAWISHVVLVETAWALRAIFRLDHPTIARTLGRLFENPSVMIQDVDVVAAALEQYRRTPSLRFSDCLILEMARNAGQLPLVTFDRALSRLPGVTGL